MTASPTVIGTWRKRTFWGLVGVLVALGVALLALNGPYSSIRSLRIATFATQTLPLVIAVLVYARVYPAASVWEIIGVAIWGYLALSAAGIFGFFLFADLSSSYPGATQEMVTNVVRFLLTTAVIGGLYGVSAAVRERPLLAGLALLFVPFGRLLLYAIV